MWESIRKNKEVAVFIMFLIIGLAVYANSFGNQFFWDDNDEIVNNAYVQHFEVGKMFTQNMIAGAGMTTNYYRPVLLLSFALDYQLWGMNSFGFNLVDILLHILNAWLIFILLYGLIEFFSNKEAENTHPALAHARAPLPRGDFFLAFLPALIFLIHPLNTETVDYVSDRADLLFSFFLLLSLILYFNFSQAGEAKKKFINYLLASVFFILSLLAKETAIILPFLAFLMEAIFLSAAAGWSRLKVAAKKTWPLFAILAAYLALHLTVFNFSHINGALTGCMGNYCSYGIFKRSLVFLLVCLNYFKILFLPFGLHMERAVSQFGSIYSWKILAAGAAILLWAGAAFFFWKKEKGIAFGFFWFFIALWPTSGIAIKVLYPTYEHFLYLAMIGFWLAIFCLVYLFFDRIKNAKRLLFAKLVFCVMLIACLVFWGILTVRRNLIWHDPITFYENNLKYSPQSFIEHTNLGIAYDAAGRVDDAIAQYRRAIAIDDVYPQVHFDLANSLTEAKQYDEAEKEYLRAISMDPGFILPYRNLYNLYSSLGKEDEANKIIKLLENIK
jgi:protein O-mannosyl-transferase